MELDDSRGDEAPQVDEEERQELVASRRSLLKRVGLGAAALSLPASVVASPAFGGVSEALASQAFIKSHPKWKFVFVNHVTTNPFFVPTQYGAADACNLLGCSYQWTGSTTSSISEMVNAFNSGDQREGRRHRGLPRRPEGVQRADRPGAQGEDPGAVLQRRRAEQPARVHRPGPVPVRVRDGAAHRRPRQVRRGRAVHRHARASSTSSRGSTARRQRSSS